jgi:hypothetical protein
MAEPKRHMDVPLGACFGKQLRASLCSQSIRPNSWFSVFN